MNEPILNEQDATGVDGQTFVGRAQNAKACNPVREDMQIVNLTPAKVKRLRLAAAFLIVLAAACFPYRAQAQSATESQVKAAYIYNFVKLAAWITQKTTSDSQPFWIGVLGGDDEFLDVLAKTVDGRSVANRPINAKRVKTEDDIKSCRVVFVRALAGRKLSQMAIAAGQPAGVLLVGEDGDFLQQGGMINLFLQNGKIHFAVNRDALDQAGIRVSPDLLQLAQGQEGGRKTKSHQARQLLQSDPPGYPEVARSMKIQGTVHLEVEVRRDGTIKSVRVLGGHPVLADAFSQAIKRWKYEPASEETVEQASYTFDQ